MQQQLLIHSDDNFQIRMYSPRSGYVFTNKHVLCLWAEIVGDRVARYMCKRGGVSSAGHLAAMLNNTANITFVATDNNGRVLMMVWFNCISGKTAKLHYMAFKRAYRTMTKPIFLKILRTFLNISTGRSDNGEGEYLVNVVVGYMPVDNELSISFIRSLNLVHEIGVVKYGFHNYSTNKPCDALAAYCTREDFI